MNQNKPERTRIVRLNLLEDEQQWFKIKVGKFEAGQVQQNGLQSLYVSRCVLSSCYWGFHSHTPASIGCLSDKRASSRRYKVYLSRL